MKDNVMWIEVNVKTNFYAVEEITKGMWFMNSLYPGTSKEYLELWELDYTVSLNDTDAFLRKHGFPVEVLLTMEMQNPDEPDDVIVFAENLGWYYDTEKESMKLIDIKIINSMIQNYGSKAFLLINEEMYDEEGEVVPEMENNLVILTYPFEEEDVEIDEEEDDDDTW